MNDYVMEDYLLDQLLAAAEEPPPPTDEELEAMYRYYLQSQ